MDQICSRLRTVFNKVRHVNFTKYLQISKLTEKGLKSVMKIHWKQYICNEDS